MSRMSCKEPTKRNSVKLVKRTSKSLKSTKSNMLRITVLPVDSENAPYTKSYSNKNNENNLKLV